MATTSSYLGLYLAEQSDYYNVEYFNNNFTKIDDAIKNLETAEKQSSIEVKSGTYTGNGSIQTIDLGSEILAVTVLLSQDGVMYTTASMAMLTQGESTNIGGVMAVAVVGSELRVSGDQFNGSGNIYRYIAHVKVEDEVVNDLDIPVEIF